VVSTEPIPIGERAARSKGLELLCSLRRQQSTAENKEEHGAGAVNEDAREVVAPWFKSEQSIVDAVGEPGERAIIILLLSEHPADVAHAEALPAGNGVRGIVDFKGSHSTSI